MYEVASTSEASSLSKTAFSCEAVLLCDVMKPHYLRQPQIFGGGVVRGICACEEPVVGKICACGTQRQNSHVCSSNNSSVSVHQSSRTATAAACLRARAGNDQPVVLISSVSEVMPCRDGPGWVKPVTTSSQQSMFCPTLCTTSSAVAFATSLSGVTTTNTLQEEVPSTVCQYQGCTVGFCGRWDSHDHAAQASS